MYNNYMLKISKVDKNSIGEEIGLEIGDSIEKFDGFDVVDILDYTYYDYKEFFNMTIFTKDGKRVLVEIEKDEDETLGLSFENDNLGLKTCRNNCVFCFVSQMPKGLRESLYVKDDDYRQSFLSGNFITLTNVTEGELDRIIRLNLSPLYVSVQATDSLVRQKMLSNRFAGDILKKLEKLTSNGIKVHTQIVLVPSLNDGAILDKSLNDLYKLRPNLQSVAVVPCGITKFREGLYHIDDIVKGYATCVINQVKSFNESVKENFAVLGDEFYFKAQLPVESDECYGDYSQIGNGVGMTRKFDSELNKILKNKKSSGKYLVITGKSAVGFIKDCALKVEKHVDGVEIKVLDVENDFFGSTVNCTGLLTGIDIINAVKNESGYDYLVLPDVCLKQDEDVFLDGVTIHKLYNEIKKPIIITDGSAKSFFDAFTAGDRIRIIK